MRVRRVQLYELWDKSLPADDHMVLYGMLLKKQHVVPGPITPPFGAAVAAPPGPPTFGRHVAAAALGGGELAG